ncbi:DNA methylase [Pseudoxanthomonas suwonensis]|uniref:DNA methylase n=1 Tax=Pseudoxanthomonas suwonensis TaxID=314722 RepID=UPI00138F36D7|nr:DNA methylase [Pseudoxanthomonas suwonensis]KAF1703377.1 DNA methylase [Pseudoxanthomonas suwonensis]
MRRELLPRDLGFEVQAGDEASLFAWFLAAFLFGNRISQALAARTWEVIVRQHGCDTPARLCACSHAQLVRMLGEGGYRRYDESTAIRLSQLCRSLVDEYDGRILGVFEASRDRADFERRLLAFRGVGPVTLGIFMREAGRALYGEG